MKIYKSKNGYIIKKGFINKRILRYYFIIIFLIFLFCYQIEWNYSFFLKINIMIIFYFYGNRQVYKNLCLEIMEIDLKFKKLRLSTLTEKVEFYFHEILDISINKTEENFEEISYFTLEIELEKNKHNWGNQLKKNELERIKRTLEEVLNEYISNSI